MDNIRKAMTSKVAPIDRPIDPPFPKILQLAVTNLCNEECMFCHLKELNRPPQMLDLDLAKEIMLQAKELGAEQVGFTAGAEPTMNPYLPRFVSEAETLGYRYVFMTTNGTVYSKQVEWECLLDAGLDSVKISVNAGTPETYRRIHGKPYFERAINSIHKLSELKKSEYPGLYLAVSFVSCNENKGEEKTLRDLIGHLIDEFIVETVNNQAGQMPQYPTAKITKQCNQPWRTFVVSVEGYYRLCCGDMENKCFVANLRRTSLKKAWAMATAWRERHLTGNLKGTLCEQCLGKSNNVEV